MNLIYSVKMKNYYESKETIKNIVEKRKADEKLSREIKNFFISEIGKEPPVQFNGGFCILARHLFVARRETMYAKALSDKIGLDLLVPSFANDRFVTMSKEKLSFVRPFFEGEEKPRELLDKKEIGKLDREKAKLLDIILPTGESLIDYHTSLAYHHLWRKSVNL